MDIVEEIKINSEAGAARLVSEYGDRLFRLACRLTANEHDAQDLVFRTFSRAIERIYSYSAQSSFFTWLCAILVNFRRMEVRRIREELLNTVDSYAEMPDDRPDPAETLALEEDARLIRSVVDGLPPPLHDVVMLRYFEDFSAAEIAEVLSVPPGTVRFL